MTLEWTGLLAGLLLLAAPPAAAQSGKPPNVVLVITDDQGYGDLGVHGNPRISTPNLDRLARESVGFRSFYVSPVCSPTRASLMTGPYNYRTGVVDTYLGRSLMHPDEVTLAACRTWSGPRTRWPLVAERRYRAAIIGLSWIGADPARRHRTRCSGPRRRARIRPPWPPSPRSKPTTS